MNWIFEDFFFLVWRNLIEIVYDMNWIMESKTMILYLLICICLGLKTTSFVLFISLYIEIESILSGFLSRIYNWPIRKRKFYGKFCSQKLTCLRKKAHFSLAFCVLKINFLFSIDNFDTKIDFIQLKSTFSSLLTREKA